MAVKFVFNSRNAYSISRKIRVIWVFLQFANEHHSRVFIVTFELGEYVNLLKHHRSETIFIDVNTKTKFK